MKILFLHEVNYLTKPIFEMHEFPEHLALAGDEVGFVHFPEGEKTGRVFRRRMESIIPGRVLPQVSLTLFTPWTLACQGLDRLVTAFTIFFQFRAILKKFQPDIVVSYSVPTSGWQSLLACRAARIPYLFRALDVSHKIRNTVFSPFVRQAEKYVYSHSDWVSANNPAMLKYCQSMGAEAAKSSVDLPPLELNHFLIPRDELLGQKLGLSQNARVYLYMGTFFYFSGLPELIKSFSRERFESDFLLLIGGGEQEMELRDLVRNLGIEDFVIFTGFVSFQQLPKYLSVADVALNPMKPSLVANAAIPNKVIQYLAAGLPVVSTRLEGLQSTFAESRLISYADSPTDVFAIAQRLSGNLQDSAEVRNRRETVRRLFDRGEAVARFQGLVHRVGTRNPD